MLNYQVIQIQWDHSVGIRELALPSSGSTSVSIADQLRRSPSRARIEILLMSTFFSLLVAWSITLALVLSMWYNVRKYPQSTGFAIPDVENHDNNENDELVFDSSITPTLPNIGYRPSGDYYSSDQGLFTESAQGYENRNNYNNNQHQQQNYHHPTVVNPFEDQGNDGATGGQYERSYADVDPYEAIRKVS